MMPCGARHLLTVLLPSLNFLPRRHSPFGRLCPRASGVTVITPACSSELSAVGNAVEIWSDDAKSYVNFRVVEVDAIHIYARVEVNHEGFAGLNPEVWFDPGDYVRFIDGLERFATQQLGAVSLDSAVPGEAALRFHQLDGARHVGLQASVTRTGFLNGRAVTNCVSVTFELSPARLGDIAHGFAQEAEPSSQPQR